MSAFDPTDGPDLPEPIREFHQARRAMVAAGAEGETARAIAALRLIAANAALKREIQSRGGSWTHGRFRYRLDAHNGIEIEQALAERADEAAGAEQPAAVPHRVQNGAVAAPVNVPDHD